MSRWKRLAYYLLLNVIVSACTVWTALWIWEWRNPKFEGALPSLSQIGETTEGSPLQATVDAASVNNRINITTDIVDGMENDNGPGETEVLIANVFGAGVLDTERVRITYAGQESVNLAGWKLQDGDGNTYTFPQLTLYPKSAVDLHNKAGINDVTGLYWGLDKPIFTSGEVLTLLNGQGTTIDVFTVP
ncbi:MAG: lamin tail domain-containing protein [Chloroflexi bacterium]|nr:MAG: lamin tail domain-containing protein [Chloroflexota bacterium]